MSLTVISAKIAVFLIITSGTCIRIFGSVTNTIRITGNTVAAATHFSIWNTAVIGTVFIRIWIKSFVAFTFSIINFGRRSPERRIEPLYLSTGGTGGTAVYIKITTRLRRIRILFRIALTFKLIHTPVFYQQRIDTSIISKLRTTAFNIAGVVWTIFDNTFWRIRSTLWSLYISFLCT